MLPTASDEPHGVLQMVIITTPFQSRHTGLRLNMKAAEGLASSVTHPEYMESDPRHQFVRMVRMVGICSPEW